MYNTIIWTPDLGPADIKKRIQDANLDSTRIRFEGTKILYVLTVHPSAHGVYTLTNSNVCNTYTIIRNIDEAIGYISGHSSAIMELEQCQS